MSVGACDGASSRASCIAATASSVLPSACSCSPVSTSDRAAAGAPRDGGDDAHARLVAARTTASEPTTIYYFVRTPFREYRAHDLADEILQSTHVFLCFSNTVTYVLARRSYPCGRSLVITSILLSRGALLEASSPQISAVLLSSAHSHTMPRRGTPPAPRTRAGSMAGRPAVMPTASDRISSATCTTPFCLLR